MSPVNASETIPVRKTKPTRGRPCVPDPKEKRSFRMSDADFAQVEKAAAKQGVTASRFIHEAVKIAAWSQVFTEMDRVDLFKMIAVALPKSLTFNN